MIKVISEQGGAPITGSEFFFLSTHTITWSNLHVTDEKHHPERLEV